MIDINILRKNPEVLIDSQKRRFQSDSIVKEAIEYDNKWREVLRKVNELKAEKNKLVKEVSQIAREGGDISPFRERAESIDKSISILNNELNSLEEKRDLTLKRIPNIVDPEAPVAPDESGSIPLEFHGVAEVYRGDLDNFLRSSMNRMEYKVIERKKTSHVDLLVGRGLVDLETAARVAGSRFYYLLGDMVLLENSLELLALKILNSKGFKLLEPPFMLNRDSTNGATDFTAFEDTLYKIEGEDLYMIATSEHPMAAFHSDTILEEESLPLFYAGISPCFRREAGAHGKDTKGIFRVHQFNKIEQFAYTLPEDSKKVHKILLENAKEFFNMLEIPYRVIDIATGDLGNVASRKFDIEAWYPAQGQFREVVSASNVLDYQARRLKIRYRTKEGNKFVHTLNSTMVATTRALVAIVENYQQEDGTIIVPRALRDIMGKDVI